jgi:heme oxygenase (biliverdin-IX-beta and delta-forming)
MKSAKTVAGYLREATHEVHKSLERLPLAAALAAGSISVVDYRAYLQRMLVLVREVDLHLADPRHMAFGVGEWSDGLRERWLGEDLAALDAEAPVAAHGGAVRKLAPAGVWGMLYVIEGSTLGGVVLARGLAARAEMRPALRYLNGYGAATGERWRRFRAELERQVPAEGLPEAVAAATDMFARFGREVMA